MSSNRWYTSGAGCSSAISTVPCMQVTPDRSGPWARLCLLNIAQCIAWRAAHRQNQATEEGLRSKQACCRLAVSVTLESPTRMAFTALRMHFTMRKVVLESKPVLISSRKSNLAGPTIISPAVLSGPYRLTQQISDTLQLKAGASSEAPVCAHMHLPHALCGAAAGR